MLEVRDALVSCGCATWMDIDGGIQSGILHSGLNTTEQTHMPQGAWQLHSKSVYALCPAIYKFGADIYDSMAAGVSGATSVVCFLSQRYQDSSNCKLCHAWCRWYGGAATVTTSAAVTAADASSVFVCCPPSPRMCPLCFLAAGQLELKFSKQMNKQVSFTNTIFQAAGHIH